MSRFASARVARLATVDADGTPHIVPFTFAVAGDVIWSAVDDKPKRSRELRRLANIRNTPAVSVLVDHYDDDWTRLWWVRADGTAEVVDDGPVDLLAEKYPQYREHPPAGPFVKITVARWSEWDAVPPPDGRSPTEGGEGASRPAPSPISGPAP